MWGGACYCHSHIPARTRRSTREQPVEARKLVAAWWRNFFAAQIGLFVDGWPSPESRDADLGDSARSLGSRKPFRSSRRIPRRRLCVWPLREKLPGCSRLRIPNAACRPTVPATRNVATPGGSCSLCRAEANRIRSFSRSLRLNGGGKISLCGKITA